jgi:enamine deaminase RidA (YjgF/YER057c/UK114 family)
MIDVTCGLPGGFSIGMTAEDRVKELGITIPKATAPAANYANTVAVGTLLFVAGKGPSGTGGHRPKGKLGQEYSIEDGYEFARQTGIEILSVLRESLGSLDRVKRVVKIQGFVNATPDFDAHHRVLNGCSDLMVEVFEERGVHARSVLGAVSLRDNLPIVIDSIFEISVP